MLTVQRGCGESERAENDLRVGRKGKTRGEINI